MGRGNCGVRWVAWAAVGLVLGAGAGSLAAPPASVKVALLGIKATKEDKEHIDPKLEPIADELKRSQFNCFRLASSDTRNIPVGRMSELPLVEDHALQVQPDKVEDETVQLTLTWVQYVRDPAGKRTMETLQKMTLTIRRGKYLLSGGWKLKEGALLGAVAVH